MDTSLIWHSRASFRMPLEIPHCTHDDVTKWKHFPRYWPFVRGFHWSPVNSPHKGQWRRAVMFSLICVWINGWVNNGEAGDLRRYRAHHDVTVMCIWTTLYDGYITVALRYKCLEECDTNNVTWRDNSYSRAACQSLLSSTSVAWKEHLPCYKILKTYVLFHGTETRSFLRARSLFHKNHQFEQTGQRLQFSYL